MLKCLKACLLLFSGSSNEHPCCTKNIIYFFWVAFTFWLYSYLLNNSGHSSEFTHFSTIHIINCSKECNQWCLVRLPSSKYLIWPHDKCSNVCLHDPDSHGVTVNEPPKRVNHFCFIHYLVYHVCSFNV